MAKYQKSPMHEGQNKIARYIRLDKIFRSSKGHTLEEILSDPQLDNISKRTLQDNIKEFKEIYGAEFVNEDCMGSKNTWRYKDSSFSIFQQLNDDFEVIHKTIEKLKHFKGDPKFDLLRFYLLGLENGFSESNVNYMSFDHNHKVWGLEFIEPILDAITRKYPLKICYQPFGKEEMDSNIHPYHLRQFNRRWFLLAYCEKNNEIRNYPLDRIISLEHLSKPYINTDTNFDEYFNDIVGVTNYKNGTIENVILKIREDCYDYIQSKPLHHTQENLKCMDIYGYHYIQIKVKINTELLQLLFSYNDAIEVIAPTSLRETFTIKTNNMSDYYNK